MSNCRISLIQTLSPSIVLFPPEVVYINSLVFLSKYRRRLPHIPLRGLLALLLLPRILLFFTLHLRFELATVIIALTLPI